VQVAAGCLLALLVLLAPFAGSILGALQTVASGSAAGGWQVPIGAALGLAGAGWLIVSGLSARGYYQGAVDRARSLLGASAQLPRLLDEDFQAALVTAVGQRLPWARPLLGHGGEVGDRLRLIAWFLKPLARAQFQPERLPLHTCLAIVIALQWSALGSTPALEWLRRWSVGCLFSKAAVFSILLLAVGAPLVIPVGTRYLEQAAAYEALVEALSAPDEAAP
jgi:hypothetical protein